jgi:hypothetical protein
LAVLRSIAPTLTSLQQQDFCDNHDEFEICDYVKVAHRIYAKHSFPRLESAELHFDVDWLKSLPGVLQAMPQLRHLTLHGRATEEMELKKPTRLPSLEKVSTLSLKPSGCYLQLLQALLPKCTSIRGFNLALDQFAGDAVDDHEVSETLSELSRCTNLESIHPGYRSTSRKTTADRRFGGYGSPATQASATQD